MSSTVFDKDTLLDLTVNIVPLAIMAFFFAVFIVLNPWKGGVSLERVIQFVIIGSMFVGLSILTYVAALRIEGGEGHEEEHAVETADVEERVEEAEAEAEPELEAETDDEA